MQEEGGGEYETETPGKGGSSLVTARGNQGSLPLGRLRNWVEAWFLNPAGHLLGVVIP